MSFSFQKAERKKAKLRLALTAPSGGGKTYSALLLAKGLGGKIAFIDTENGSASLYSHIAEFDVLELKAPYSPERYIEAIQSAELAGYDVIIIDSLSHEWNGSGGALEINEQIAQAKCKGNTWSAWNITTPRHRALVNKILQSPCHIIGTMRSKTETVQTEVNGYKKIAKVGMKSEQRDGIEYEFTIVLELTHDGHFATASKDRTNLFQDPVLLSEKTGAMLLEWLNSGVEYIEPVNHAANEPQKTFRDHTKDIEDLVAISSLESLATAWNAINSNIKQGQYSDEGKQALIQTKEDCKKALVALDKVDAA